MKIKIHCCHSPNCVRFYVKYYSTDMWVYAGKFVLWVTIMQVYVCMYLRICIYCRSTRVICAKSLLAKTIGRDGKGVGIVFLWQWKTHILLLSVHLIMSQARWSCLTHKEKHSNRKMDTYAHFWYAMNSKYWTICVVNGFNFTVKGANASCVTDISSCTLYCAEEEEKMTLVVLLKSH